MFLSRAAAVAAAVHYAVAGKGHKIQVASEKQRFKIIKYSVALFTENI